MAIKAYEGLAKKCNYPLHIGITEAGGKISEPSGNKWEITSKDILATNSLIHQTLQDKIS